VNRLTKLMTAAVPAICLAACTGSLFQSKTAPPTVYLLSAGIGSAAAGPPAAEIPVDLAILRLRVRTGLESDRIAILYPDRRLDYFAGARWSGPLGEVLQDLAVQEFHSRAHLATVSGDASVFASGYWLEIAVTDFQAEYTSAAQAPTVHVQLLASIGSSNDTRILGQFVADARLPATENRLSAIVDAFARAADAALAEIAAHAGDTLAKSSKAR
jgi:cholesterol transport system auxiliary component